MFMKNEYAWLSNMCLFPKPIIINNEEIKSSEHYYHSRKTTDPILRKQILDMDNPYEVKKFCKTIKIRDDWDDIKISVMEEASDIKYTITYFRLKLIACLEPIIEENKHYDIFWGTCNGKGENNHGKILTKLRDRIIKEECFKRNKIMYGDLYNSDTEYKCFTANSTINKDGALVMGKGNALTVKNKYPGIDKRFGNQIENKSLFGCRLDVDTNIIAFQTKVDWQEDSYLDIIKYSVSRLNDFAIGANNCPIGIPFPGINNGNLNENIVISSLLGLTHYNIKIWKDKPNMFFTGIGSRETPEDIGNILSTFCEIMTRGGYVLRSGGAPGADLYCEKGVVNTLIKNDKDFKEIYIPWKGFNGSDSMLYTQEDSEEVIQISRENHPAYEYLKPPVKKLMNRNVYQVLGYNLDRPSEFVICYTSDGCKYHKDRTNKTGGTGLAISVASKNNIPIINLGNDDDLKMVKDFIKVYESNKWI